MMDVTIRLEVVGGLDEVDYSAVLAPNFRFKVGRRDTNFAANPNVWIMLPANETRVSRNFGYFWLDDLQKVCFSLASGSGSGRCTKRHCRGQQRSMLKENIHVELKVGDKLEIGESILHVVKIAFDGRKRDREFGTKYLPRVQLVAFVLFMAILAVVFWWVWVWVWVGM
jgi:hypothetical protein